jgi:hypothetical protein
MIQSGARWSPEQISRRLRIDFPHNETMRVSHDAIYQALYVQGRGALRNALAETIIGLCKTEVIRKRGPWRNVNAVEYATLEWVDWFNNRRLLEPIGDIPPAEYDAMYYQNRDQAMAA